MELLQNFMELHGTFMELHGTPRNFMYYGFLERTLSFLESSECPVEVLPAETPNKVKPLTSRNEDTE